MASISLATRAAARAFSVVNIMGLDRGLRCRLAISDAVGFRGAVPRKGKSLQLSAWIIDLFHLRQTYRLCEKGCPVAHIFFASCEAVGLGRAAQRRQSRRRRPGGAPEPLGGALLRRHSRLELRLAAPGRLAATGSSSGSSERRPEQLYGQPLLDRYLTVMSVTPPETLKH